MSRWIWGGAFALLLATTTNVAQAGVDVSLFLGGGGPVYGPPPVVYGPPPVVYQPAPVIYAAPPSYYGFGYYGGRHRHRPFRSYGGWGGRHYGHHHHW